VASHKFCPHKRRLLLETRGIRIKGRSLIGIEIVIIWSATQKGKRGGHNNKGQSRDGRFAHSFKTLKKTELLTPCISEGRYSRCLFSMSPSGNIAIKYIRPQPTYESPFITSPLPVTMSQCTVSPALIATGSGLGGIPSSIATRTTVGVGLGAFDT
jgi:hypothetical protein